MNILEEICYHKKQEIVELKKEKKFNFNTEINKNKKSISEILRKNNKNHYNIITEIKRKSPSAGLIRKDFNLIKIAENYIKAGAVYLSVLTEKKYFGGDVKFIKKLKENTKIPILRKDFIIDEWQIYESLYYNADCILLILAILDDDTFIRFYSLAKELGLSILVEVHDEEELRRALSFNVDCIGINNRNLKTLKIDLNTFKKLSKLIPKGITKVCESGISKNSQLLDMTNSGADAFLIGESLMKKKDIFQSTQNLIKKHDKKI